MRLPQVGRDDQVGKTATDGLLAGVAEGLHRSRIELAHDAVLVHGDDAVEGGLDDPLIVGGGHASLIGRDGDRFDRNTCSGIEHTFP